MPFKIDQIARDIALRQCVLPECLHVPVAALNEEAITTYIVSGGAKLDHGSSVMVSLRAE